MLILFFLFFCLTPSFISSEFITWTDSCKKLFLSISKYSKTTSEYTHRHNRKTKSSFYIYVSYCKQINGQLFFIIGFDINLGSLSKNSSQKNTTIFPSASLSLSFFPWTFCTGSSIWTKKNSFFRSITTNFYYYCLVKFKRKSDNRFMRYHLAIFRC